MILCIFNFLMFKTLIIICASSFWVTADRPNTLTHRIGCRLKGPCSVHTMHINLSSVHKGDHPLSVVGLRRNQCPVTLDCDGIGSIPAILKARNVPLLLCHELLNEASLPAQRCCITKSVLYGFVLSLKWSNGLIIIYKLM